jgi:hypothetical protein
MSAVGSKRTFHFALPMSAFGGKADIEVKDEEQADMHYGDFGDGADRAAKSG